MLRKVVEAVRNLMEERRGELSYENGGVGISSLAYCPLKWEFKREYPDLRPESVEIDDGTAWELLLKEGIRLLYPDAEEEKKLLFRVEEEDFLIEGHLDLWIPSAKTGIEVKHTRLTVVDFEVSNDMEDVLDAENPLSREIPVPEQYLLQARLELFVLREEDPDAEVFLWIKTTLKGRNGRFKKVVFERQVEEPLSREEVLSLVRDFKEKKAPRWEWECRYCVYSRLCPYQDTGRSS